ncbi:hypothetical protein [Alteraurantiacibacter palmitatis]|uniref:OmpA family protein n=1 Tax=Alteraurantiacibacter palmitatis TaxID=2054628 RepID=A0ABV7E378_9SPHN
MRALRNPALVLALAGLPLAAAQASEAGDAVRFIACPVYRDTDAGLKSGCWLATDPATGVRWDVTMSPHKPDWNHAVLVEGTVAGDEGSLCGAPSLDPVRTSVLDMPCVRHMLPAEGYPGRRFELPPRNINPRAVAPVVSEDERRDRTFTLFFAFDQDFVVYQYSDYLLDQAAHWIRAAEPRRLVVTGFAASAPEDVSGTLIAERAELAQLRADKIALSLSRLFPGMPIETHAVAGAGVTDHPDADGIPGQSQRRVEIIAQF